jgi:predicted CoA-binding protein
MDIINEILTNSVNVAVVGLSSNPERESYRVANYLQDVGYRILPVNPAEQKVLGEESYSDLMSIPESVDLVDIFRKSEFVGPIVDDAIRKGVKYIWMQDGVVDEIAATRARSAGIFVVMDNCIFREHKRRNKDSDA